jgi:hypothetical protein
MLLDYKITVTLTRDQIIDIIKSEIEKTEPNVVVKSVTFNISSNYDYRDGAAYGHDLSNCIIVLERK